LKELLPRNSKNGVKKQKNDNLNIEEFNNLRLSDDDTNSENEGEEWSHAVFFRDVSREIIRLVRETFSKYSLNSVSTEDLWSLIGEVLQKMSHNDEVYGHVASEKEQFHMTPNDLKLIMTWTKL